VSARDWRNSEEDKVEAELSCISQSLNGLGRTPGTGSSGKVITIKETVRERERVRVCK